MFVPETRVPVCPNPIVESTEIIEEPIDTVSSAFEFPGTSKTPSIKSLSLYPTNNPSL